MQKQLLTLAAEAVEVPEDVAENWIDQLTIKQFNEELKDVFPYVYKLIGEATKAEELGPDDLMDESALMAYAGKKKHKAEKESIDDMLEAAIDQLMGQFAEASTNESNMKKVIDMIANSDNPSQMVMDLVNKGGPVGDFLYNELEQLAVEAGTTFNNAEAEPEEFVDELLANMGIEEDKDEPMSVKMTPDGGIEKADEKPKTPIGEFILSYFDRENGTFPKGETAVLTMVEKDYGEQYVEPAARFIQKVESMVAQRQAEEMASSRYPETDRIKALAGLN